MPSSLPALEDGISQVQWLAALDIYADDHGSFETLGDQHCAAFVDGGTTLIVSFETPGDIARRADKTPLGMSVADQMGWSSLTLVAQARTWWRAPQVYGYFDRLVDDGFFEDFDHVVFCGAGAGGYAAATYSVVAPGATVIAVAPQATLDPGLTAWDARFAAHRRLDFTSRYGFAPDMIDAAGQCFVLFDPLLREDAMHAALFRRPATQLIPLRHFGTHLVTILEDTGVMEQIVQAAGQQKLTPEWLFQAARHRHHHDRWLKNLLDATNRQGHTDLAVMLCEVILRQIDAPRAAPESRRVEAAKSGN